MTTVEPHFIKDPNGIIDYTVRWTSWLGTGDTISSSSWIMPAGDIVQVATSNSTVDAVIRLASGTVGQLYEITNRIITANGEQNDQTISVLIRNK
jgi:hypothetical protein